MANQPKQAPKREHPVPAEVWVPADPAGASRDGWFSTGKLLLGGSLVVLFMLVLGFTLVLFMLFFNSDLIVPGVSVMGVDVGSMTRSEAEAVLEERWQQQKITLEHDDSAWLVPAAEIGMMFDAQATVESAYAQGRSFDSLLDLLQGSVQGQPVWSFDAGAAASSLATFAPQLAVPSVNANLKIEQGNVLEIPAAEGRALDMDRTMAYLTADPAAVLMSGRLPLATHAVSPTITDVNELAAEARRLLSISVLLHAYDPVTGEAADWVITPENWGSWLTLSTGAGDEEQFHWMLDENAAANYLDTQLPGLGEARYLDSESLVPVLMSAITAQQPQVNTRIFHYPRQHLVQSGETLAGIGRSYGIPYPWIQQANPGSEILQAGSTIIIPSPDEMLPLPVVENKRIIVSISEQEAWVYEDGQLKWEWPASTGIDDSPTAPGIFQIQNHEQNAYASNWDLWMPSFMGIYRPVPNSDFMNGFHGFPTRSGSNLLWTGDLGHKVTYGCILLSSDNAALLYDWADEGVVVEVQP